ncbi:hypothetical protein ES703_107276 [subsurface metagenome]
MTSLRDILKYDQRTRAGQRATAQANLRLVIATDEELRMMAKIYVALVGEKIAGPEAEELERLKNHRAQIREKGIKRSEIEWP